jgi:SPP1 family predicted phage head-tail adaptor
MRAGDLRHLITIKRPTTVSDSQGGDTVTLVVLAKVWAAMRPLRSTEVFETGKIQSITTQVFVIRYRSDVHTEYTITLGSREFEILDRRNVKERGQWLELFCKENEAVA